MADITDKQRLTETPCTAEGCERFAHAKLMCVKHYRQVRNYGKLLTPEHKSAICRKANKSRKTVDGWRWAKKENIPVQRSRFYYSVRPKVLERDNYTCQICTEPTDNPHVDHIKSWRHYPELRFEVDNCRTLCAPCHYYITYKRKIPKGICWGNIAKEIA